MSSQRAGQARAAFNRSVGGAMSVVAYDALHAIRLQRGHQLVEVPAEVDEGVGAVHQLLVRGQVKCDAIDLATSAMVAADSEVQSKSSVTRNQEITSAVGPTTWSGLKGLKASSSSGALGQLRQSRKSQHISVVLQIRRLQIPERVVHRDRVAVRQCAAILLRQLRERTRR